MSKVLHKKLELTDSRLLSLLPQQFSRAVYFENGQELFVGLGAVPFPERGGNLPPEQSAIRSLRLRSGNSLRTHLGNNIGLVEASNTGAAAICSSSGLKTVAERSRSPVVDFSLSFEFPSATPRLRSGRRLRERYRGNRREQHKNSQKEIFRAKNTLCETVKQAESFFAENPDWRQGRFFGGVSFDGKCPDFWADFGSSAFVFPRLQIMRRAGGFEALLFMPPNDEENDFWFTVWNELEKNLNQNASSLAEFSSAFISSSSISPPQENQLLSEHSFPDKKNWEKYILQILADIQSGNAEKIVPARQVLLEFRDDISLAKTLFRLRSFLPQCTIFAFKTGESAFVGATPETLVRKQDRELKSEALAGTMPLGCEQTAFLVNEKERREHACVLQHIVSRLTSFCSEISAPSEPQLRELSHLVHLCSPISARLQEGLHILRLAEVLHPTPAVCGLPVSFAKKRIGEVENFGRGWYSGFLGWFDAWGNGDFRVALRCALLNKNTARLYAGAGVVQGSNAEKEFLETETKLRAMRSILG